MGDITVDYRTKVPIQGDGRKLLEQVRAFFMQEGYTVSPISGHRLEVSGGYPLQKNRSPIHGVSNATFMTGAGSLLVEADLGGIRKLRNFFLIFLPGLGTGLAVVFWAAGLFGDQPWYLPFVVAFAPLSPWVVILPLLIYFFRKRTMRALDTLLENLSTVSGT